MPISVDGPFHACQAFLCLSARWSVLCLSGLLGFAKKQPNEFVPSEFGDGSFKEKKISLRIFRTDFTSSLIPGLKGGIAFFLLRDFSFFGSAR